MWRSPATVGSGRPSSRWSEAKAAYLLGYAHGKEILQIERGLSVKRDPERHAGSLRTRPWSVRIEGEVARPRTVAIEDLLANTVSAIQPDSPAYPSGT